MDLNITKEDILTHFENQILEAFDNDDGEVDEDGDYIQYEHKFSALLNSITERVHKRLVRTISEEELKKLREGIYDKLQVALDKKIADILEKPFTPLNTWGKPSGEETTIKDEFLKRTENYWTESVDTDGRPSNRSGTKFTRAEFLAKSFIKESFDKTIKENLSEIVGAFQSSLATTMKTSSNIAIDEALKKLIKI